MNAKLIFTSIAAVIMLAEAEIDIVVPSLPGLMAYYNASAAQAELALSLNLIAHAIAGLWVGDLADRFGKKRILLFGIFTFMLGSVLTVSAANIQILLFGRILQGAGMSAPMVVGFLIAIQGLSKSRQEARMATLNSIANISLAFTPAVGSVIAVFFGWHANFQFLLIFSVLVLCLALYGIPAEPVEHLGQNKGHKSPGYRALISNPKVRMSIFSSTLLPAGWFTFVGVASIVYVEHFGVSLGAYGWHQGGIALLYGISTLLIYRSARKLSSSVLVLGSLAIVALASTGLIIGFIYNLYSPFYITIMVLIGSIGSVILVNKTQLAAIHLMPGAAGKISALTTFSRWTTAAVTIQISGTFFSLCPVFSFALIAALWIGGVLLLGALIYRDPLFKALILN